MFVAGQTIKYIMRAVPVEFVPLARNQFHSWKADHFRYAGRCMIPQSNGILQECPRKRGNNRCACSECLNKGLYERKNNIVSLEQTPDTSYVATEKSSEESYLAQEDESESKRNFIRFVEDIIKISPKHTYALLLMCLGYKGTRFAECMRMTTMGAHYIRHQVTALAPNGIAELGQVSLSGLTGYKTKNDDYYRREAEKAMETVIDMYF